MEQIILSTWLLASSDIALWGAFTRASNLSSHFVPILRNLPTSIFLDSLLVVFQLYSLQVPSHPPRSLATANKSVKIYTSECILLPVYKRGQCSELCLLRLSFTPDHQSHIWAGLWYSNSEFLADAGTSCRSICEPGSSISLLSQLVTSNSTWSHRYKLREDHVAGIRAPRVLIISSYNFFVPSEST